MAFEQIGIRPDQRAWLRLWRANPDLPPPVPGSKEDNATQQFQLLLEAAMAFWPDGSNFASGWPRDEQGRFTKRDLRSEPELLGTATEANR